MKKWINHIKSNYFLIAVLALAAILRFYNIDYQSVWLDEIHTLLEADPKLNWQEFHDSLLVSDPHPPLYFALIKLCFTLFGHTSMVVRVFSAVVGVVGVYSVYLLGKAIKDKNTGLIAALLLSVNYFHIYYSQEARMYVLLFLFTVLSFYRLVLFVKNSTYKNALWYGVLTGLMMLTHFFALFVLVTQGLLLLYFFIQQKTKSERLHFFKTAFVSLVIVAVFFLPAISLFIKTTQIKNFWIPPTTADTIHQIFKDFFFNCDALLIATEIIIFFYLVFLLRSKNTDSEKKAVFFILIPWLILVVLIPVIRSYLSVPMIISRYFITVLPPVILLTALGINALKIRWVQLVLVSIISLFSIHLIAIENEYYTKIAKTQFREITNHVIASNPNKHDVVSLRAWHLNYFFKDKNTYIESKSFEEYVTSISKDSLHLSPFWYVGAFGDIYKLTKPSEDFVNNNFIVQDELFLFDCWTKHYVPKNYTQAGTTKISGNVIQLLNITDENWFGGVSKSTNMLLLSYSDQNQRILEKAKKIKIKNKTVRVVGFEKTGNYLHIFLEGNAIQYKNDASYPNTLEVLE